MALYDYWSKNPSKISYIIYMANTIGSMVIIVMLLFLDSSFGIDPVWWNEKKGEYYIIGCLMFAYSVCFLILLVVYYTKSLLKKMLK